MLQSHLLFTDLLTTDMGSKKYIFSKLDFEKFIFLPPVS